MSPLDPASARKLDHLVNTIHGLRREVRSLQRATPARHTAVDSGPGLPVTVTDVDGQVIERIAPPAVVVEPDPVPPAPAAPTVEALAGVAVVGLSGLDVDGEAAPRSVVGTRVYASLEPGFAPSAGSLRIAAAPVSGEVVLPVTAGVWHVRTVWTTRTGTVSAPSADVVVDLDPLVDTDDIEATLQTARDELAVAAAQATADLATLDQMLSERIDTETGKPITLDRLQPGDAVEEVLDSLYSQLAVVDRLTARSAWIGGALIRDNAITVEKINVTAQLTAALLAARKVQAGEIEVNALVASAAFIAALESSQARFRGVQNGLTTTVSGSGLVTTRMNTDSGVEVPVVSVGGAGENSFATYDAQGTPLGGFSADGAVTASAMSSESDPVIMGTPLLGSVATSVQSSEYGSGILDQIGWGEVAYFERTSHSAGPYTAGSHGLMQVHFDAQPGRQYELYVEAGHLIRNGSTITCAIRFTNDGSNPTLTSPTASGRGGIGGAAGTWGPVTFTSRVRGSSSSSGRPVPVRAMLLVGCPAAFAFVSGDPEWRKLVISVRDVGPIRPPSGASRHVRLDQGGSGGGTDDQHAPTTREYTSGWQASGWQGYHANGQSRTTSGEGARMLKQGQDPYWTNGARQSSLFWLASGALSGETGRTRTQALSGASIKHGSLSIRGEYAPYVRGGTEARTVHVYAHGHTSAPSSYAPSSIYIGAVAVTPGRRRDLPLTRTALNGLANGSITGFGFYTTSAYWGDAVGISWQYRPSISITYER